MQETEHQEAWLESKDFYEQACAYFHYHAEQRTTMINYFIAVFGACVALYGSLISTLPFACVLIAGFLFIVSLLFYFIDLRNRFDVKQSQDVICQFERNYNVHIPNKQFAYGVFSNEDAVFLLYDSGFRKSNEQYKELMQLHKTAKAKPKDAEAQKLLAQKISDFVTKNPTVSAEAVRQSLSKPWIPHLSTSIKLLYFICMAVSVIGLIAAVLASVFPLFS